MPFESETQHSRPVAVVLSMTASGQEGKIYMELPLRQRVPPDANLPRHLKSAKIVALLNKDQELLPFEQLNRIICRIHPVVSQQERATFPKNADRDWVSSPWFTVEDGVVRFEEPGSRWFLVGREVESYECR
ncbi:hypothetical protein GQ43DRAFT_18153 [Delitschia confertaspora ATCC 74209]|uniref:Uncharacterized protein n=1 Tax=Delitschia confertaspora ATCC 74209 TaxID=1513339 RepID=A0A9P4MSW5_9PLEO|nr:hypothetical protein GQ43DRAFT_18153 [Delitschia confertaspora ATCC 74209]